MRKFAMTIRVVTIAPVMALILLILLLVFNKSIYGDIRVFWCAIFFLSILPTMSYPMQPLFPHFKRKGREGQRNLAMVFAMLGYIFGCVACLIMSAPKEAVFIYFEYLFSGLLVIVFNKVIKIRASGHACGVVGPVVLLMYFKIPFAFLGIGLIAIVMWASLYTKRHTWQQFLAGALIPVAVFIVANLIM